MVGWRCGVCVVKGMCGGGVCEESLSQMMTKSDIMGK